MGFLASLRARRPRRSGAAFPAADLGRLSASWTSDPGAINRWLRYELRTLRARSRQLARGDAYGAKFIAAAVDNIAGPDPFRLECKFRFADGRLNSAANDAVEQAFRERSEPGAFEVTGRLSRGEYYRLIVRCIARDGEVLVRKLGGAALGGARRGGPGLLQVIDIDRLDEQKNEQLANGNTVKLGVELSPYGTPVAYWLLKQHPGEMGEWNRGLSREHERVPAEEIRHLYVADWPEQVRGFPWMHAAMVRMWHLSGFEEAAVINARIGASKIAALQSPDQARDLVSMATAKDAAGNMLTDIEPGQYWTLPPGTTLASFDPQFPDASVEPFIRACLRGVGAGVNMAYHTLANDPGAVNYSTAQVFRMDDGEHWKALQRWLIEHECRPDFNEWLRHSITERGFPKRWYDQRATAHFQPRTWAHVDEQKAISARIDRLTHGLTSRTRIAAETGEDIEDIFRELAEEQELARSLGVNLAPAQAGASANASNPAGGTGGAGDGEGTAGAQQPGGGDGDDGGGDGGNGSNGNGNGNGGADADGG